MKSFVGKDDSAENFERASFLLETELAILESFEKLMQQEEQNESVKRKMLAKKESHSIRYRRSA